METIQQPSSNELPDLSDNACELLFAVHGEVEVWHTWLEKGRDGAPLTMLDRLRGLAAHVLLIVNSGEYDVDDAVHELRFGLDGEESRHLEVLLAAVPPEEDEVWGDQPQPEASRRPRGTRISPTRVSPRHGRCGEEP